MEKRKKILLVNMINEDVFNTFSGGGLRSNLFIKALSEIGDVDVICFSKNDLVSNNLDEHFITKFPNLSWSLLHLSPSLFPCGILQIR